MKPLSLFSIACLLCALLAAAAPAQTAPSVPPSSAPVAKPAAGPAPAPAGVGIKAADVLTHLGVLTRWYRDTQDEAAWILQPADQFYWNNQQVSSNEAVKQGFTAAQAVAVLIPAEAGKSVPKSLGIANPARMNQVLAENEGRIGDLKTQIAGLDRQLSGRLAPADRASLQSQRATLAEAEQIDETLVDYIGRARGLMTGSNVEAEQTALTGQIQAIRASVRGAFAGAKSNGPQQPAETDPSGTFAQAALVVRLVKDEGEIDRMVGDNGSISVLVKQVEAMRDPLRTALRDIVQRSQDASEAISNGKTADAADQERQLSGLASTLRDVTDASLALRAEEMALEQNRSNLNDWKGVIVRHRDVVLRSLVMRLIVIAVLITVLVISSELWRRATFRYVHDLRRRRQLLLVRRVAYGSLIAIVLVTGLVSNLGSLATFAGFITAGIAVASQTIIVSIAAFFFMMGRNGVHVGDRVTVTSSTGSTVTGKIVEIDLVRFSVMELTGSGLDLRPTGRIASYANALLFQTVPFFKHITGADYGWHEIVVPLKPEADFDRVQKLVLEAVNQVYAEYRKILENQRGLIERQNEITLDVPEPTSQVLYGAKGPELVTGYPIDRTGRISMDLRVAHSVRDALKNDKAALEMTAGDPQMRGPTGS